MRYRYILCGVTTPTEPINNYRLIGSDQLMGQSSAIRIKLPEDLVLEKCKYDNYSTTMDSRTIESLGYDVMIKINGKWIVRNDLKLYQHHEYSDVLLANEQLYLTTDGFWIRTGISSIC